MKGKRILLLSQEEMLKRLLRMNDDYRLKTHLYPILLEKAGQDMENPVAIVNFVQEAIGTYEADMPADADVAAGLMPELLYAIIDDKAIIAEAKSAFVDLLRQHWRIL